MGSCAANAGMRRRREYARRRAAVAAVALDTALLVCGSKAAVISKANFGGNLNLGTNWIGGVVPGAGDVAQWNSTVTGFYSDSLGANLTWGEIQITNPGGAVDIYGSYTLTLNGVDGTGIDQSSASQNLTINSAVTVANAQTWYSGPGRNLVLFDPVSAGAGGGLNFNETSGGTIEVANPNTNGIIGGWATLEGTDFAVANGSSANVSAGTYTNDTWATGDNTTITASNSLSNATTNSLRFASSSADCTLTLAGTNHISSGGILVSSAVGGHNETITGGTLTVDTAANYRLNIGTYGTGILTIGSQFSGIDVIKAGPGTLVLTSSETFGSACADGGTLTFTAPQTDTTSTEAATVTMGGTLNVDWSGTGNFGIVSNSGIMNVAAGAALVCNLLPFTQSAGALNINGSVALSNTSFVDNGGTISGTVTLDNSPANSSPTLRIGAGATSGHFLFTGNGGGQWNLAGSVAAGVTIDVTPSGSSTQLPLVASGSFTNAGTINLNGYQATNAGGGLSLSGSGSVLTNTGTLNISTSTAFKSTLMNSGTVNILAPATNMSGQVTNTGIFIINSGTSLTSSGAFIQSGGTVTVEAGGTLFPGVLVFNGGFITIAADANSPGKLELGQGGMQFAGSSGTVVIASGAVGVGQSPGVLDLGTSSLNSVYFNIGNGSAAVDVSISAAITDRGGIDKANAGTLEFSGADTYTGPTTVSAGTLILASATALPANNAATISTVASVVAADHGSNPVTVLVLSSLTNSGLLDLVNNSMIVHNGSLATLSGEIATAYSGGTWAGASGITSSAAAAAAGNTALGIELNSNGNAALVSGFESVGVTSTDVLVKYTYFGDANLDGVVDGSDYTLIDNGFNNGVAGWRNGDFNYDGVVNGDDYTLIDNAFNTQGASLELPLQSGGLMEGAEELIAGDTAQIDQSAAVPEPICGPALLASAALLVRRRGRHLR